MGAQLQRCQLQWDFWEQGQACRAGSCNFGDGAEDSAQHATGGGRKEDLKPRQDAALFSKMFLLDMGLLQGPTQSKPQVSQEVRGQLLARIKTSCTTTAQLGTDTMGGT